MTDVKVFESAEVARRDPARKPSNVGAVFKAVTFEVAEPVEPGSLVKLVRVPEDVTVFALSVCVDRQGDGVLRVDVGDDEDAERYISHGVFAQGGGRLDAHRSGSICDYTEAATIDLKVLDGDLQPGDIVRAVVGYVAP